MDAINNYLSSSDSEDNIPDIPEQNEEAAIQKSKDYNFFNLEDNYEASFKIGVENELQKIKNSILLEERTNELHDSEFGPSYQIDSLKTNRHQSKKVFKRKIDDFILNANLPTKKEKQSKFEDLQNKDLESFDESILRPNLKIESFQKKLISCSLPKSCQRSWKGHSASVTSLEWNVPSLSHLFLSSSLDGTIKLWNRFTPEFCKVINIHSSGVKKALFTNCGTKVFSGSLDKSAVLFDITTGRHVSKFLHPHYVTAAQICPDDPNLFLTGTFNKACLWDGRSPQAVVRSYPSNCGQILDLLFLSGGSQFVCSAEVVSQDCPTRTLMVWDTASGAKLSNQIYQEFYTCSSLRHFPGRDNFVAQSSGGYVAIFSSLPPYKVNKRKVFQGHKVEGYPISCDFSPDGQFLTSGDAEGRVFIYRSDTARVARTLTWRPTIPSTTVAWHPVMASNLAVGSWDGHIAIYQ